jgi:hypothetical protein
LRVALAIVLAVMVSTGCSTLQIVEAPKSKAAKIASKVAKKVEKGIVTTVDKIVEYEGKAIRKITGEPEIDDEDEIIDPPELL